MKIIKNAKILTHNKTTNIVFDEKIIYIGDDVSDFKGYIIDAKELTLLPGLIDVHVHLREPGFETKEDIASGTKAAAKGGFTTICAMPNLNPYPDCVENIKPYLDLIKQKAIVNVYPYACITKGEKGEMISDFEAIKKLGINIFSDDGVGVASDEVMKQAQIETKKQNCLIVAHTEDMNYRKKEACMHEGEFSEKRGFVGIPSECESEQLKRDIKLLHQTNASYHACHISAKKSVDLLREAKKNGLDISAEVTTHHLLLEDKDAIDANYKMNPPLRSHEDRLALIKALEDGTIDFIANDHAPHTEDEKKQGMINAPFGVVALETSFSLLYTEFVKSGRWSLEKLIELMSLKPAKRFGFKNKGEIKVGFDADFFLVDLEKSYKIDKEKFYSKGKNTPFNDRLVKGFITKCFVGGKEVLGEKNDM